MGRDGRAYSFCQQSATWFAFACLSCANPPGMSDAADVTALDDVAHTRSALGGPCASDLECTDGDVCVTEHQGFPNGTCTRLCHADPDCGPAARCIAPDVAAGRCFVACASQSDCRTREGYRCLPRSATAPANDRVCAPTLAPIGTRGDDACFTIAPGPHTMPALASRTFAQPALATGGSGARADGNLAIGTGGSLVAATLAVATGTSTLATVSVDGDGGVRAPVDVRDPAGRLQADPTVAYLPAGTAHAAWLSYVYDITGTTDTHILVSASADNAFTWGTAVEASVSPSCDPVCDKPWLSAGNGVLVVAYQSGQFHGLVSQQSSDGGNHWSAPVLLASDGDGLRPQLVVLATAPDGVLHAVYVGLADTGTDAPSLGDVRNRVLHRTSRDGGATWGAADAVSDAANDSPVYLQPSVTFTNGRVHVAYVSGTRDGAWDVVLASAATSTDGGGAWLRRTVNDEPERCATHTLPVIAGDVARDVVHVSWLDNRFGTGLAGYTRCSADAHVACETNQRIGNADFAFTTSRDPLHWHGDYGGLVVDRDGAPWVRWSDTRTGTPVVYLAHGTRE